MARYFKYSQKLNVEHKIGEEQQHMHTLELILYLEGNSGFAVYDKLENHLEKFFDRYEGKYLNSLAEFAGITPTIENIGFVFYDKLKTFLKAYGYAISQLHIGENPGRLYAVTDFLITGSISGTSSAREKNVAEYIEQNYEAFLKEYEAAAAERLAEKEAAAAGKEQDAETQIPQMEETSSAAVASDTAKEKETPQTAQGKSKGAIDATARIRIPRVRRNTFWCLIAAAVLTVAVCLIVYKMDLLGATGDVYLHFGKGEYLLSQLLSNRWSPIYMENWYNGYLMFMHSEPLTYYLLALCGMAAGSVLDGYIVFMGLVMFVGIAGFIRLGKVYGRPVAGFAAGILWFFLPEMTRGFFITGDIKLLLAMSFVPLLTSYVISYYNAAAGVSENTKKASRADLIKAAAVMCLMVLSDLAAAVIIALTLVSYLFIRAVKEKGSRAFVKLLLMFVAGFGLAAVWIYSAFVNNSIPELSVDTRGFTGVMPVLCLHMLCIILGGRKAKETGIIGLLTCFIAVYFIPQAVYASCLLLFIALVSWENNSRLFMGGILLVIFITNLYYFDVNINYANNIQNEHNKELLCAIEEGTVKAGEVTDRKLLYLEVGKVSSFPAYYMTYQNKGIVFANSSGAKYNMLADNIRLLEYALYGKKYEYLFDRSIELGCDTILIYKNELNMSETDAAECSTAGNSFEYECVEDNEAYLIYHREFPGIYGVETSYEGIAIGDGADAISILYPYFRSASKTVIDDYTFEELSGYKKVYLSGFTYRNLNYAQQLVTDLAQSGVDIYIDMGTIQADPITNRQVFLGVTAQNIVFKDSFPVLKFEGRNVISKQFYKEYDEWNTVYLEKLDEVLGTTCLADKQLPFYGTKYDGKVHFIGFNIIYHAIEADDDNVIEIIDDIFDMKCGESPERNIAQVVAEYDGNGINITADKNVVIGIAMQKNFVYDSAVETVNNLIAVNQGTTRIDFDYTSMYIGVVITIVVLCVVVVIGIRYEKGCVK